MKETHILWEHRPSQGANLGVFLSCFLVVTWPLALWRYLRTGNTHYMLKEEKLIIRQGIRKIRQEDIFLHEIEEVKIRTDFFLKLTGLGCITLFIRDQTNPAVKLSGLEDAVAVKNIILRQVAEAKKVKAALQRDD